MICKEKEHKIRVLKPDKSLKKKKKEKTALDVHRAFEGQGLKPIRGHKQQEEEEGWVKGAGPAAPFEVYVCTSLRGPLQRVS